MKFYIVDAFAEELFGGNPAGVVIIPEGREFPDKEVMQKTAAELRYSETAFVLPLGEDKFKIRYFTPTDEVDLCGHATIASFRALIDMGLIAEDFDYCAETLAGDIKVNVNSGHIMMSMAEPKHIGTITDEVELDRLYEIMGGEFDGSLGLNPMVISTGLPDIMMPVGSMEDLNALYPHMEELSRLSKHYGVTGVHAFFIEPEGDQSTGVTCTLHARNFAPLYGIDEEAATGTSNGALTHYLHLNNLISAPAKCKVIQGEAMGRPSVIMTSLKFSSVGAYVFDGPSLEAEFPLPPEIFVGGSARILAKGDINI